MRKNIVIIGFGEMGKRHAREYEEATGGLIKLAGVYEPSEEKYREGCAWINARPKRYASPAQMIAEAGPDGIIIASPNDHHLENLRELKGSRIAVLLEKPLESSLENICAIVKFAAAYNGPIIVDHVMRYAPIVRRARQIIAGGLLGKVCSLHFIQRHGGGALFHTYRRALKEGGGQMLEKATHDLDVMLFLADATPNRVASIGKQQVYGGNKPNDLRCSGCKERTGCLSAIMPKMEGSAHLKDVAAGNDLCSFAKAVDVRDNETSLIELENGIFGTYSHCYFTETKYSREYEIIGTLATMTISFSGNPDGKIMLYPRAGKGEIQEFRFDYGGKIHYAGGPAVGRHFYEVMCGRARPFTTVNQAFVAEMLSCAAMRAQEKNAFVNVADIVPATLGKTYRQVYARPSGEIEYPA